MPSHAIPPPSPPPPPRAPSNGLPLSPMRAVSVYHIQCPCLPDADFRFPIGWYRVGWHALIRYSFVPSGTCCPRSSTTCCAKQGLTPRLGSPALGGRICRSPHTSTPPRVRATAPPRWPMPQWKRGPTTTARRRSEPRLSPPRRLPRDTWCSDGHPQTTWPSRPHGGAPALRCARTNPRRQIRSLF